MEKCVGKSNLFIKPCCNLLINKHKGLLLVPSLISLVSPHVSMGKGLEFSGASSTSTSSFGAQYSADLEREKKTDPKKNWNIGYTRHRTKSTQTSGAEIVDITHDVMFGGGIEVPDKFSLDGDFLYSTTPEEGTNNWGPSLTFSQNFDLVTKKTAHEKASNSKNVAKTPATNGKSNLSVAKNANHQETDEDDEFDDDEFVPTLGYSVTLGYLAFQQSFSGTIQRRLTGATRPISGKSSIAQKSIGLGLRFQPLELLGFKVHHTRYTYDKDVQSYLQYLDNASFTGFVSSGYESSVQSFLDSQTDVKASFYVGTSWTIDVGATNYVNKLDSSKANATRVEFEKDWRGWHFSAGAEVYKPAVGETSKSFVYGFGSSW